MNFERGKVEFTITEGSLWMPIYTQPLHEFRLHRYLTERGIPNYLPVLPEWKVQTVNSGKKVYEYKRKVLRPMFRSYMFAQLSDEQKKDSWNSKSIIRILDVPAARQRCFIEELRGVQMMEALGQTTTLEFRDDIKVNDRFLIESGPFEGTYGWLVKKKKQFLWVVKVECMGTYISTELDPSGFKMTKFENT